MVWSNIWNEDNSFELNTWTRLSNKTDDESSHYLELEQKKDATNMLK